MSVRVTSYESRENLYLRVYKNWQRFFYKLYNFFKSISTSIRFNIYHFQEISLRGCLLLSFVITNRSCDENRTTNQK